MSVVMAHAIKEGNVKLKLKYPPVASNAPLFASDIVEVAKRISGIDLDYSVASLDVLDSVIENMRRDGVQIGAVGVTLFGFGAYLGEVFVQNAGAQWIDFDDARKRDFGQAIGVRMSNGLQWNPIGKVFKRFQYGVEDSVSYFYRQAVLH
jgi:hypothetical protein